MSASAVIVVSCSHNAKTPGRSTGMHRERTFGGTPPLGDLRGPTDQSNFLYDIQWPRGVVLPRKMASDRRGWNFWKTLRASEPPCLEHVKLCSLRCTYGSITTVRHPGHNPVSQLPGQQGLFNPFANTFAEEFHEEFVTSVWRLPSLIFVGR